MQLCFLKVLTLGEEMLDMQEKFIRVQRVIFCWTLQYLNFACSVKSLFLNVCISKVNRRFVLKIYNGSIRVIEKVVSFDKYPVPITLRHNATEQLCHTDDQSLDTTPASLKRY